MDNKSFRSIGIVGTLAKLAGLAAFASRFRAVPSPFDFLKSMRARKQYSSYIGCPKNKFAHMSRQRLRYEAKRKFTDELRRKFQMPRRVLRAIVRTRVNREWRLA